MKYLLSILLILLLIVRIIDLSRVPNGFYWDEMDNTYQAYSLLKTGKDLFGNPMPVLLHAFADYKPSLYIYATVPFVKVLGLTQVSAKATAVLFGIISILTLIYIVGKEKGLTWGLASGLLLGISPWWFSYSRLSFEAVSMVGLFLIGYACLNKSLKENPKYIILAGLFWSLSIWAYSTARLFVPLFGLIVLIKHFKLIFSFDKKIIVLAVIVTGILTAPVMIQSLFGKGNTRFNEISVFTDPTRISEINYALEQGEISSGVPRSVGLKPRLVDRLVNNKYKYWSDYLLTNYLRSFSARFLFLEGDINLRQSPGINVVGQLLPIDFILLGLGLAVLAKQKKHLLLIWLVLAPLPSIITRDGGAHATRLLFMLPPLIIIMTDGLQLLAKHKKLLTSFLVVYGYFAFCFVYYYFSYYRFESMVPFHWGFGKVAQLAIDKSSQYSQVIIDLHHESGLMAYLIQSRYDPKLLHSQMPLKQVDIFPGVSGNKFDNIFILPPGERSWSDYLAENKISSNTLLILSADQKPPRPDVQTIYYPSEQKAFFVLSI